MRIAYLSTRFPTYSHTFVLNEIEAHFQAGVDVLPLSCDRVPAGEHLSKLSLQWRERTIGPRSITGAISAVMRETIFHPSEMLKNIAWIASLLFIDPIEFVMACKELFSAACLAPACRVHRSQWIHVHFASRSLDTGIMLSRLVGIPVSCTAHAFELFLRSGRNLRYRLKNCVFVATVSNYNIEYIRNKCGQETADRCHLVHCGIDLTHFDDSDRRPLPGRLVLVSRFCEQKGHTYLIDACAILKSRGIKYECILIGNGPEERALRRKIERLGLGAEVKILGLVPNDRIKPYLDSAVAFVLPAVIASNGDRDGIPVALMEAMASGLPVISTRVSGIPELLRDGQAGILVPERNAEELAAAIERVLASHELPGELSKAGRLAVAEDFNIVNTSQQIRMLIAENQATRTARASCS